MRTRSNEPVPGANELDDDASVAGLVVEETNAPSHVIPGTTHPKPPLIHRLRHRVVGEVAEQSQNFLLLDLRRSASCATAPSGPIRQFQRRRSIVVGPQRVGTKRKQRGHRHRAPVAHRAVQSGDAARRRCLYVGAEFDE